MKLSKLIYVAVFAFLMAGCNHPDLVKIGEPYQKVMNQLGVPDSKITLPDGSIRVVYSKQPMSPHVYALIFSPDGTLIKKEQILYKQFFVHNIKPHEMNQEDIDKLFGRPCEKRTFGLSNTHAYMYRYEQDGVPWALWVDFDNKTNEVLDWTTTIDPWSLKGGDNKK